MEGVEGRGKEHFLPSLEGATIIIEEIEGRKRRKESEREMAAPFENEKRHFNPIHDQFR